MATDVKETTELKPLEFPKFRSVKVPEIEKKPGVLNDQEVEDMVQKGLEQQRISKLGTIRPTRPGLAPKKAEWVSGPLPKPLVKAQ